MIRKFDKSASGKFYRSTQDAFVYDYRPEWDKFAAVNSGGQGATVALSGWWTTSSGGYKMYQTVNGQYIDIAEGWTATGKVYTYSQADAQSYVNKLIANNKQILQNNLLCARFKNHLSTDQKQTLYNLQSRLQSRNLQLVNDGLVTQVRNSEAYGYSYLNGYLEDFMLQGVGVGLVVSTTTIVVSCVVIAALSTAAYFAYLALYKESAQDVKYSDELTKTLLTKLTPEEYQQLLQETQGVVTKAKIKSRIYGYGDVLKYGLIAAGGYFLYKFIKGRAE